MFLGTFPSNITDPLMKSVGYCINKKNSFAIRLNRSSLIRKCESVNISVLWRKEACIQLKFNAISHHQVYYLYYAIKITKVYVKINTPKICQVMKLKT